ncbi:hypothetical protein [Halorubrum sp. DTA46]|uniref:hypothetical protein n=1 Tax=Halorubrum sp. DTA46 TaxID=3402162 RepID=UPI003AAB383B
MASDRSGDEDPQPAQRFGGQAISSRVRIEDAPFTVQVYEPYRGELQFIRLGTENIFQIRASGDDARGTARVEISNDELEELHEAIGEVLSK